MSKIELISEYDSIISDYSNGNWSFGENTWTSQTIKSPYGFVQLYYQKPWFFNNVKRKAILAIDFIWRGRQYTRSYEHSKGFSHRYAVTLARRFAREIANDSAWIVHD